ncbi:hypothetical protein [Mesorhizobium sp. B4-1-4]|nr:hypothetical protein [Mesorhizobium sp. B4-1-4]
MAAPTIWRSNDAGARLALHGPHRQSGPILLLDQTAADGTGR